MKPNMIATVETRYADKQYRVIFLLNGVESPVRQWVDYAGQKEIIASRQMLSDCEQKNHVDVLRWYNQCFTEQENNEQYN